MASAARTTRPPKKARRPTYVMNDELLRDLGVPANRVRLDPPPGTATAKDVYRIYCKEHRKFELTDGTLVEKAVSVDAGFVAINLILFIGRLSERVGGVGMLLGGDAFLRISSRYVRAPDVSFTHWDRLPNRKVPREPIPTIAPDLAVEVLSPSNTPREMKRKRKEYFDSGVRLVWVVDPKRRTVQVYTSADEATMLGPADTLTGGGVLPALKLTVADLFTDLPDEPVAKPKKGGAKRKPKK
ncbi:MAG: Uma2 family endonuclease [Gemmataceae bacterium]|nr:Uma2 family endonuclease [Gemmataceae bacterium]